MAENLRKKEQSESLTSNHMNGNLQNHSHPQDQSKNCDDVDENLNFDLNRPFRLSLHLTDGNFECKVY